MINYYSDSESNIYFNGKKNSLLLAYHAPFFLFWNKGGCNCFVDRLCGVLSWQTVPVGASREVSNNQSRLAVTRKHELPLKLK